jgi:peptidoglycan/LPS O-acetylase OafA/YrhL
MKEGTNRIPELDGLRKLAIALVILFHIELLFPSRWHMVGSAMLFGWSGVDLFVRAVGIPD